ncbi:MAG: GntR family transcriptional regulator [Pseudomonadota bacterium]
MASRLRDAVANGHIAPGDHVVESAIARDLGLSRAPVREAIRMLCQQGLMTQKPNRGFFVRQLSAGEIEDIFGLMVCLEVYALQCYFDQPDGFALKELTTFLKTLKKNGRPKNLSQIARNELHIHRLICGLSQNQAVIETFAEKVSVLSVMSSIVPAAAPTSVQLAEVFDPLIDAIMKMEKSEARRFLRAHLAKRSKDFVSCADGVMDTYTASNTVA